MSYDVKCYQLADVFLTDYLFASVDHEPVKDRLAQVIQTTIEDELGAMEDEHLILEKR